MTILVNLAYKWLISFGVPGENGFEYRATESKIFLSMMQPRFSYFCILIKIQDKIAGRKDHFHLKHPRISVSNKNYLQ